VFGVGSDDYQFLGRQAEITFVYRVPPVGEAGRPSTTRHALS
jgi:hypothetical protein